MKFPQVNLRSRALQLFFEQLRRKWSATVTALLALTGFSNVLYVDGVTGNDATAVRGSFVLKYATINAAIAAAHAGDTIKISAGTYTQNINLPALSSIELAGEGMYKTILTCADMNLYAIRYAGAAPIQNVKIRDMSITGGLGGGASPIIIDGSASGGASFAGGAKLRLVNVGLRIPALSACTDYILINDVNEVELTNVVGLDDTKIFFADNVSSVVMTECTGFAYTCRYEVIDAALPAQGPTRSFAYACQFGDLIVQQNARATFDKACTSTDQVITLIDDAAGANVGRFEFHGLCNGIGLYQMTAVNGSFTMFDCQDAVFTGAVDIHDLGVPSTNRTLANFRGATLGGALNAGAWIDIDLTGGAYGVLTAAGGGNIGTIERDFISAAIDLSGGPVVVTFTVPRTTAAFNVAFELGAGGAAGDPVTVDLKTAAGFRATPAGVGAAANQWTAVRQGA